MAQRSFKLPDDLDARLEAEVARLGKPWSVSSVIVRALEAALAGSGAPGEVARVSPRPPSAASPRAPVVPNPARAGYVTAAKPAPRTIGPAVLARQQRLNEGKDKKR